MYTQKVSQDIKTFPTPLPKTSLLPQWLKHRDKKRSISYRDICVHCLIACPYYFHLAEDQWKLHQKSIQSQVADFEASSFLHLFKTAQSSFPGHSLLLRNLNELLPHLLWFTVSFYYFSLYEFCSINWSYIYIVYHQANWTLLILLRKNQISGYGD